MGDYPRFKACVTPTPDADSARECDDFAAIREPVPHGRSPRIILLLC